MPRYHFHVSKDQRSDFDLEGTEFRDAAAAGADALRYAGGMIRDRSDRSDLDGAWRVEVVDEAGTMLFRVGVQVENFSATQRTLDSSKDC